MKNLFIAAVAILSLTSCHNDDDAGTVVLPKSGSDIYEDGETVLANFEFDGNKLKRITWTDDSYETYEYENGKIKYINLYIDGELYVKKTFTYDGDKLATVTDDDLIELWREVVTYTYNSNNSVSIEEYDMDLEDGEDAIPELNATGALTITNGNITKFVRTYTSGVTETNTYTFDNKYDPYKNVAGFDIMKLAEREGGVNNYLSYTLTSNEVNTTTTYINTYNDDGYLTKAIASTSGSISTSTYNY